MKEVDYLKWLQDQTKIQGRDVSKDEEDFKLKKHFDTLKASSEEGGHLSDQFKRGNHPTFSDQAEDSVPVINQGGSWTQDDAIPTGWKFKPSQKNIENAGSAADLQRYFNEVESPEALDIPNQDKLSKEKLSKLRDLIKAR
jgi:hypothetical protein